MIWLRKDTTHFTMMEQYHNYMNRLPQFTIIILLYFCYNYHHMAFILLMIHIPKMKHHNLITSITI